MADIVDTPAPPAEGQVAEPTPEPVAETPLQDALQAELEPKQDAVPVVEPEPPPAPKPLTEDEIAEKAAQKAFDRMASWDGRRQKEFLSNVANLIDQRIGQIRPQAPPEPPPPTDDPATVLNDPRAWLRTSLKQEIPALLGEMTKNEQRATETYNNEIVRVIGQAINTDPIFSGEETEQNKGVRKEILDEITAQVSTVDRRIPPQLAAKIVFGDAITNVFRKKTTAQVAPLGNNKPVNGPIGGLKPGTPPAPKAKPVALDDVTKAFAAAWKVSPEEVNEYLKD
jgi:hypothetical protein